MANPKTSILTSQFNSNDHMMLNKNLHFPFWATSYVFSCVVLFSELLLYLWILHGFYHRDYLVCLTHVKRYIYSCTKKTFHQLNIVTIRSRHQGILTWSKNKGSQKTCEHKHGQKSCNFKGHLASSLHWSSLCVWVCVPSSYGIIWCNNFFIPLHDPANFLYLSGQTRLIQWCSFVPYPSADIFHTVSAQKAITK